MMSPDELIHAAVYVTREDMGRVNVGKFMLALMDYYDVDSDSQLAKEALQDLIGDREIEYYPLEGGQ
jgi:hypothetical protein